jgi:hypothetical protein
VLCHQPGSNSINQEDRIEILEIGCIHHHHDLPRVEIIEDVRDRARQPEEGEAIPRDHLGVGALFMVNMTVAEETVMPQTLVVAVVLQEVEEADMAIGRPAHIGEVAEIEAKVPSIPVTTAQGRSIILRNHHMLRG